MNLEEQIRTLVRTELAEALKARGLAPATYSSANLPPDLRSKDRFHRIAPKVPGARKVGRVWHVDAEAWHAYRAGEKAPATTDDAASVVARMLRAS